MYEIFDTDGLSDTATVHITIDSINDAPVAVDDSASTDEDVPVSIPVLVNDSAGPSNEDPSLTIVSASDPANGSVAIVGGEIVYTPDANYHGTDSFTYTIEDSEGLQSTATVVVSVASLNDAPEAVNDSYTINEDSEITFDVSLNDSDVDGNLDPSSVVLVGNGPEHGTLVNQADGTFTYTTDANYNGTDSFMYQISDTDGLFATATVDINILPVNDAPEAVDDYYSTQQDTVLHSPSSVLDNDSDIDGDELSIESYDAVTKYGGDVSLDLDGNFTYTPSAGFAGYDTFTYTITDGNGETATATVTIEVQAKNNRSISVDLQSFNLDGTSLSGQMLITNQSGNYDVQVTALDVTVQYRSSTVKQWTDVAVIDDSCLYNPEPHFLITDSQLVAFSGCELAEDIGADATVRVTANVKIYGRIKGQGKSNGWFLSRLTN